MKLKNWKIFCGPLFASIALLTTDMAQASQPVPIQTEPLLLEIVSPVPPKVNYKKDKTEESRSIQFRSGWPLTFKLSADDDQLLGTYVPGFPLRYPEAGIRSWLMFDPGSDACFYMEGQAYTQQDYANCELPYAPCTVCDDTMANDEAFLEFTPDVDLPDLADGRSSETDDPLLNALRSNGRPDLQDRMADPDNRPEWGGPFVNTTLDGIGYGPNDDLPGLVVLSNVGIGITYEPLEFLGDCNPVLNPGCSILFCDSSGEEQQCTYYDNPREGFQLTGAGPFRKAATTCRA